MKKQKKIYNLVFISHPNEMGIKERLFQCPVDICLEEGDSVICITKKGRAEGICASNSFLISEQAGRIISEKTGGYWPPAKITAVAYTVTEKRYGRI